MSCVHEYKILGLFLSKDKLESGSKIYHKNHIPKSKEIFTKEMVEIVDTERLVWVNNKYN